MKVERIYNVYIIANISRMLYVGVTGDMHLRMFEHKNKLVAGYSRNYNLQKLVCYENFADVNDAIAREKAIKGWLRSKKTALIQSCNPRWDDLAAEWFKTPSSSRQGLRYKQALSS